MSRRSTGGRVALRGTLAGALDLAGPVARRCGGDELVEQRLAGLGHCGDSAVEGLLVDLRRLGHAADLAHVLQCGRLGVLVGARGLVIMKWADVSAHGPDATRDRAGCRTST